METIRIIVADRGMFLASALEQALKEELVPEGQQALELIAHAVSAKELYPLAVEHPEAIVVLGPMLDDPFGVAGKLRELNETQKTIVLNIHVSPETLEIAIETGLAAQLPHNCSPQELIAVIRKVHGGEKVFAPDLLLRLLNESDYGRLTVLEIRIVRMLAQEKSRLEMARRLGIAIRTLDVYKKQIRAKLRVKTDIGVVLYGLRMGLV